MQATFAELSRLLKLFSFTSRDKSQRGAARPERKPEPARDVLVHEEIQRARVLMTRIEATGVKFPVQINDAIEQAWAAHEENRWTLQVDRSFYSTLGLLESIMRLRGRGAVNRSAGSDPSTRRTGTPGWTVIISNNRKMLDGNW
jgi:hypothetical protein